MSLESALTSHSIWITNRGLALFGEMCGYSVFRAKSRIMWYSFIFDMKKIGESNIRCEATNSIVFDDIYIFHRCFVNSLYSSTVQRF